MRAEPVAKFLTPTFKLELGVEEAVLETKIDVVGDGGADPGDALPSEAPIATGETKVRNWDPACAGAADVCPHFNSCDACTTSDEAAEAIIFAKVQQEIDHPREHSGTSIGFQIARWNDALVNSHLIQRSALVADFAFNPDQPEIMTANQGDVETSLHIDAEKAVNGTVIVLEIEVDVLDLHEAALNTDVSHAIARQSRCCHCRRSNRHYQKLPHGCPFLRARELPRHSRPAGAQEGEIVNCSSSSRQEYQAAATSF
jgi:hypothetical protein